MNTKITKTIKMDLTEKDIKDAICHYVTSLPSRPRELDEINNSDFNIEFHCEMSSPDTFGEISANITINQTL